MDRIETLFTIKPDAPREYPVDALMSALEQADAIIHLLICEFCYSSRVSRASDGTICAALMNVGGHLEMIKAMVEHGYQATQEAAP